MKSLLGFLAVAAASGGVGYALLTKPGPASSVPPAAAVVARPAPPGDRPQVTAEPARPAPADRGRLTGDLGVPDA